MMKQEFETLVGATISDEEWYKVEIVYMYYDDGLTKDDMVTIWKINPLIIDDMYHRALKVMKRIDEITRLMAKIDELKKEVIKLTNNKVNFVEV